MTNIKKIKTNTPECEVYDISLDGTVVNALGFNILSNTDGFNFVKPSTFRYTDEHPYISNGGGRNSVEGKAYTGVDADVAEFEDIYMNHAFNGGINKNGLGIDEYCDACINLSRKNYADLMPDGSIKLVGNTIKSKKMPLYIEKFLDKAIRMLLNGQGYEFINFYYDYIDKIYNYRIPLKEIATVGKIKISLAEYKKRCNERTAAGTKKSRQAWYELAILHDLPVHMGDTIYYINTGTKKGVSDVKRTTVYKLIDNMGVEVDYALDKYGNPITNKRGQPIKIIKYIDEQYKKYKEDCESKGMNSKQMMKKFEFIQRLYPRIIETDNLEFNCKILANNIVEDEDDHFCDKDTEYNVPKYLEMFNKRIKPLLVCFKKSMRETTNAKGDIVSNILIDNPKNRKYFTKEDCELCAGEPFDIKDQDTYEQLMTIEDKEIRFWLSKGTKPPYVEECGIDWNLAVENYNKHQLLLEENIDIVNQYNKIIDKLTNDDRDAFANDGIVPSALLKIVHLCDNGDFAINTNNVVIGNKNDILDYEEDFIDEDLE